MVFTHRVTGMQGRDVDSLQPHRPWSHAVDICKAAFGFRLSTKPGMRRLACSSLQLGRLATPTAHTAALAKA